MEGFGGLTDPLGINEPHTPLRLILLAISEEFGELGRFADRVQFTLSPAARDLALDLTCHRDVQSLDLLSQRLAALSEYISAIGKLLPEEFRLDSRHALASITLSELQYRLSGAPLPVCEACRTGELELF